MSFKNITRSFVLFLKTQRVSENTLRNYLVDVRHFFSWLSNNFPQLATKEPNIIAQNISSDVLKNYKNFLKRNGVSSTTVNRRLSSLRKLASFFVSQGWLENNPGKKVANITNKKELDSDWQVLERFAKSLEEEGKSASTIRNYLSDARGYLNFLNEESSRRSEKNSSLFCHSESAVLGGRRIPTEEQPRKEILLRQPADQDDEVRRS